MNYGFATLWIRLLAYTLKKKKKYIQVYTFIARKTLYNKLLTQYITYQHALEPRCLFKKSLMIYLLTCFKGDLAINI